MQKKGSVHQNHLFGSQCLETIGMIALDDEIDRIIGNIIRRWARLDHWAYSEVRSMQMILRIRHVRLPSLFPDEAYTSPPPDLEFNPHPGKEVRTRFRHLNKIAKTLYLDRDFGIELDSFQKEAMDLYKIRNTVAHSESSSGFDGAVSFVSHESADKAKAELERIRARSRREFNREQPVGDTPVTAWTKANWQILGGTVTYRMDELQAAAEGLELIRQRGAALISQIPLLGDRVAPVIAPRPR